MQLAVNCETLAQSTSFEYISVDFMFGQCPFFPMLSKLIKSEKKDIQSTFVECMTHGTLRRLLLTNGAIPIST